MEIIFITGNAKKLATATRILNKYNIKINNIKIETPEIQADDSEEVAKYSAKWAAEKLQKPVVVSDVGWQIPALNGFPGVYMKYAATILGNTGFLKLMEGKKDRTIIFKEVLAYCEPSKEPIIVSGTVKGEIQHSAEKEEFSNWSVDSIIKLEGCKNILSKMVQEERDKVFAKVNTWDTLAKKLKANNL